MVIEAICQAMPEDGDVASIHVKETRITKAIVVPDDATGIKVVLQLINNCEGGRLRYSASRRLLAIYRDELWGWRFTRTEQRLRESALQDRQGRWH